MRTNFPRESGDLGSETKDSPNIPRDLAAETDQTVSFPKRLRHKGKGRVLATIYKRPDGSYRLYWRDRSAESGKPRSWFKDYALYGAAKRAGDDKVAELAKTRQAIRLSPGQSVDALAAFQRLERFYRDTGRRISLLAGISDYCEAAAKLPDRTVNEAVDGYLGTVASVKRKDLSEAVEEFISAESIRTKATDGQRPQLSPKYHYNRSIMLRRFAAAFSNAAVSELAKEHLDIFIGGLAAIKSKSRNGRPVISAKGRNHHRAAIRQFLTWAARRDYVPINTRLGEADAMRPEHANHSEVQIYTPTELQDLLAKAEGSMRAMIAIGSLAGLRTQELLRLDWADVWRVQGHIEVTAGKSKTRQRRLAPVCRALAAWLRPFRSLTQGKICRLHEITWQQHFVKLCEQAGVARKPNGLRHSFCSYAFVLHGEIRAAQDAGHSPSQLHAHYKGLATKAEARKWFGLKPATSAMSKVILLPESVTK
jgi:integrase